MPANGGDHNQADPATGAAAATATGMDTPDSSAPKRAGLVLIALIRRRGRQPEPGRGQRRAAGHRRGVRLLADDPQPDRGRLLARTRGSVLYLGALGDRYGRKLMLMIGTALAIPASLLAALAPPHRVLFVARLLGGLAAGMAYPTTLALITALWSGPGRTRSIALWSATRWRHLGARAAALGLPAASTSGGARCSSSPCRWRSSRRCSPSVRSRARERGHRPGRQPRRDPLVVLVGALVLGDQLRCRPEQGQLVLGLGGDRRWPR